MPQTERFCLNPYMNEECFLSKTLYVATFFSYVPFSYARIAFLSNGASFDPVSISQVRGQKITTIYGVLKANTIGSGGKSAGPQAKSNDEPESVSQVVQRERKCPSTPPILPSLPTPRSARIASKPATRGVASK